MNKKVTAICPEARLLPITNIKAPFAITPDGMWLRYGDKRIPRRTDVPYQVLDRVPDLRKWLNNLVMDQSFVQTVFSILDDFKADAVSLAEGDTAAAKTTAFVLVAALLNLPMWRVNHSEQIDPGDILGRYVPNSAKGQSQLFKLLHDKDISRLDPESRKLINSYRYANQGRVYMKPIAEDDLHQIADLENIDMPMTPFTLNDGPLPESATYGGLYLADELNLAPADRQSIYNPVFEAGRKIRIPGAARTMSRYAAGRDKVSEWFRIGAAQNQAGTVYGMRHKQSQDLRGRVMKRTVEAPTIREIKDLIAFLTFGLQPEITHRGKVYKADDRAPQFPSLMKPEFLPFYGLLGNFHHKLQELCVSNILNRNRKQKLTFTRRDIISFLRFLSEFESIDRETGKSYTFQNNPVETFLRGIDLFYSSRFKLDPDDRQSIVEMKLNLFGVIDKEYYLTTNEMFGKNFHIIRQLFVNPYSDNLIVREDAVDLLKGLKLPGKLNKPLGELIAKAEEAKISDAEKALDYFRLNHKPRAISNVARPVIEKSPDGKYLYIHDLKVDIRNDLTPEEQELVPNLDTEGRLCLDRQTVRLLVNIAIAHKYDIPLLIEGLPATTKTSGITYFDGLINQPVHRINFNGRTNPADVIGKYVPSDKTLAARYMEIICNYNDLVLTEETVQLIESAQNEQRTLTEDESKRIAVLEGLYIPATSWIYLEEDLLVSNRKGHTAIWDELNQSETNVGERFNSLLERPKSFLVSEHDSENLTEQNGGIHKMSRNYATGNPAEFPGKKVFSPAAINRWSMYLQIDNVSDIEIEQMLTYLIYGSQPEIEIHGYRYAAEIDPVKFDNLSRLMKTDRFLKALAEFHYGLSNQVHPVISLRKLAKTDQELLITRRELIAILKKIDTDEIVDTVEDKPGHAAMRAQNVCSGKEIRKRIITDAIEDVYLSKFTGTDRNEVKNLLDAAGLSFANWAFDEIEELLSPEKAAPLLQDKFKPELIKIGKAIKSININPAAGELENQLNNARSLIDQLMEIKNELSREMHKFKISESMMKDILILISGMDKEFEIITKQLNMALERIFAEEREEVLHEVDDLFKEIDSLLG
ncbi:MAG: hypothetical protein PHV30_04255 [Candidatus Margulisbacteria bacterium]|nr:hypothetical protein [Candidatus Margulisiibacteriota bacterium]